MYLKDPPIKASERCNNYPCRSLRAGHDIYCQKCRVEMTAAIEWLRLRTAEPAK